MINIQNESTNNWAYQCPETIHPWDQVVGKSFLIYQKSYNLSWSKKFLFRLPDQPILLEKCENFLGHWRQLCMRNTQVTLVSLHIQIGHCVVSAGKV